MKYSIVIPLKNEEHNIIPLLNEIKGIMDPLNDSWEVLCINDGSTDQTSERLKLYQRHTPCLRVITFTKNYGQSAAFKAGFDHSQGEWIISLDGDGQNDPKDIVHLIELSEGYDMILGYRTKRKDNFVKRISSYIANKVRQYVCNDNYIDINCSLKIFRRTFYKNIKMFNGMHRFLPILFELEGGKVKQTPVNHRFRTQGKSHYHFFNRSISPLVDMFAVSWMRKRNIQYQLKND